MSVKDIIVVKKKIEQNDAFKFGRFYQAKLINNSVYINNSEIILNKTTPYDITDFYIYDKDYDYPGKYDNHKLNIVSCIYLGRIKDYTILRGIYCTNCSKTILNDSDTCYFVKSNDKNKLEVRYFKLFSKSKSYILYKNYKDDSWIKKMIDIAQGFLKSNCIDTIYAGYPIYFDFKILNIL